jgi:hypothetical protein
MRRYFVEGNGGKRLFCHAHQKKAATTNNCRLQIVVVQQATHRAAATFPDHAIVSFNRGSQLKKFGFGEKDELIYIPKGLKKCATAYR